jgi:hypothetical protein
MRLSGSYGNQIQVKCVGRLRHAGLLRIVKNNAEHVSPARPQELGC